MVKHVRVWKSGLQQIVEINDIQIQNIKYSDYTYLICIDSKGLKMNDRRNKKKTVRANGWNIV